MVLVPPGDGFSASNRKEIESAIDAAENSCGFCFTVHVGPGGSSDRRYAERVHAELADPAHSVLVHVDPQARRLDIVTGSLVKTALPNRLVALAAVTMETSFSNGDLVGGLIAGLQQMGELARRPESLHTDTP